MKYLWISVIIILGELVGALIFWLLECALKMDPPKDGRKWSIIKGTLERLTLMFGLVNNYSQILTAFGALKIATRVAEEKDNHISNTYFLVGNLITILFAMAYTALVRIIFP